MLKTWAALKFISIGINELFGCTGACENIFLWQFYARLWLNWILRSCFLFFLIINTGFDIFLSISGSEILETSTYKSLLTGSFETDIFGAGISNYFTWDFIAFFFDETDKILIGFWKFDTFIDIFLQVFFPWKTFLFSFPFDIFFTFSAIWCDYGKVMFLA